MNRFSKLIIFSVAVIGLVSCSDGNSWSDGVYKASFKASFIYFPQSQVQLGGSNNLSSSVKLQSINTPWRISNPASNWLKVSQMEGTDDATITFTAETNPSSDNVRTALLTLESTENDYTLNKQITVNQGKANGVLTPSEQSIEFARGEQTQKISIDANTDWTATCSSKWVHLNSSVASGFLEIGVDANIASTDRTAQIVVSGSISTSIAITQHGFTSDELISELDFEPRSTPQTLNLVTDESWKVSSNDTWLHFTPTSGTGNTQLSISVDDNTSDTRNGLISVSIGQNIKYIIINQKGPYLDITTSSNSEILADGGSRSVTFTTSENWTVETKHSWVSADKMSGSPGVNTITLTFLNNNLDASRIDTTYIMTQNEKLQDIRIITKQNYHEYVDLGLPSGTLWAKCNIGASSQYETGAFFAWGETTGHTYEERGSGWSTYKWCNGTANSLRKYCTDSQYGIVDNLTTLEDKDDAAHVIWEGYWRIPTSQELDELEQYCSKTWTQINNIYGLKFTSNKNGSSIFFPSHYNEQYGYCIIRANSLYISNDVYDPRFSAMIVYDYWNESGKWVAIRLTSDARCEGCPVRPVRSKNNQ